MDERKRERKKKRQLNSKRRWESIIVKPVLLSKQGEKKYESKRRKEFIEKKEKEKERKNKNCIVIAASPTNYFSLKQRLWPRFKNP